MQKTILPKYIIDTWDYFLIANAYLKKLRPNDGFVGGFNMMVMAGVFNNPQPVSEDKRPEQDLIDSLEEAIPKIESKLQASILDFFSYDMCNVNMAYRMMPICINYEDKHSVTEYRPSLVFIDEALNKILSQFGRLEAINFAILSDVRNKNEAALVFADRKSLIKFVKEKDITINAFGKKWKP